MKQAIMIFAGLLLSLPVSVNAKTVKPESLPQDSVLLLGETAFANSDFRKAITFLNYYVLNNPTSPDVQKAQFHLAESYYNLKKYDEASVEYEFLYKQYPGSQYSEQAQIKAATSKFETSEPYYKEQITTLDVQKMATEFLRKYPNSIYAPDARKLLARIDEKLARKELEAAKLYFKFKEYNAAVMSLEYILGEYPLAKETNFETSYYLGLCKMKLGELEEAQALMEELSGNQKWQKKAQKVLAKIAKELE